MQAFLILVHIVFHDSVYYLYVILDYLICLRCLHLLLGPYLCVELGYIGVWFCSLVNEHDFTEKIWYWLIKA